MQEQFSTGDIVDRYQVEGLLGEGGMAVVYAVRHKQLGTRHALKVLTLSSKQIRQRLKLEGQVQARLRHPNVVAVTDQIEIDGAPGLIMELVEGPALDAWLHHERPDIAQVDELARQILGAVAAAHEQELIHRDLKPANILLEVGKKAITAKITDFGLAKVLGEGGGGFAQTRTGSTMGTPHYMSPEQIDDSKGVGPQTDVFALGAILYEMLAGKRCFPGEGLMQIFHAVHTGRYTPIEEAVPGVPDRMRKAVEGALRVKREDRFETVEQLLACWVGDAPSVGAAAWDLGSIQRAASMTVDVTGTLPGPSSDPSWRALSAEGSAPTVDPVSPVSIVSPAVAEYPASAGPMPPSPTSMSTGSMVLGVGGVGVIGVLLLLVIGLGGGVAFLLFSTQPAPAPPVPAQVVVTAGPAVAPEVPEELDELEKAVLEAAADGDDPIIVAPDPAPVADGSNGTEPGAVEGDPVDATEGEDGEVADGDTDAPTDDAATDDGLAEAEIPEAPAEVADVEDVVEELDAADPRAELPQSLRSSSTASRLSALSSMESHEDATRNFEIVVKHDPHPDVRKKAWKGVASRWKNGVGVPTEHQAIAVWVMNNATADDQLSAIASIARNGNDVTLLAPKLEDHRSAIRRSAVEGISQMAKRTGASSEAKALLQTRLAVEEDARTKSRIEDAIAKL